MGATMAYRHADKTRTSPPGRNEEPAANTVTLREGNQHKSADFEGESRA